MSENRDKINGGISLQGLFEYIFKIQKKTIETKKTIEKELNLSRYSQDIRLVALDACRAILKEVCLLVNAILIVTKNNNNNCQEFQYLCKNNNITLKDAQECMGGYVRRTIIMMLHFQIDNLFNNIIKALNIVQNNNNFKTLIGTLRGEIQGTDEDYKILLAFSYMRNCFHNNGIHNNSNFSIEVNNETFEFIKGKNFPYSIDKILIISEASINVVCKWLLSEKLMNELNREIIDPGAQQITEEKSAMSAMNEIGDIH